MKYKYILAIDPSGSFEEGKGTTGWVLMDAFEDLIDKGTINAEMYNCKEEYWDAHIALIDHCNRRFKNELLIVIEEYVLYRDKAVGQTNSKMETCRLIGLLQWYCWTLKQTYSMQLATSVKDRWSDGLLMREGIIYKDQKGKYKHKKSNLDLSVIHTRDAFRHAIHYVVTRNRKDEERPKNKYFRGAYRSNVRHRY